METKGRIIALLTLIFILSGCIPISYDGNYKGRVVDAETSQPIEGAVVLGVWYKDAATVAGTVGKYYDAREIATNSKGEFKIPGQGVKLFGNISEMHVLIFKAGYEYKGSGPWRSLKIDEINKKKISWEGDMAIIPLRKLAMEERKARLFGKENVPDEKQILLIRELNKERVSLGLSPYEVVK